MQATEAEKKSAHNDESINFRPSPNFKHMKKYLKSKFEESKSEESNSSSDNGMPDHQNEPETAKTAASSVQPPLPPNSPPPECPLNIKQEIEDDYQCSNTADSPDLNLSEDSSSQPTEQPITIKPELTMCRNFIRGTCTKGAACIFAHKLILSQLPGVYTFCKNFQNRQCTRAKCKFVHATVFEKEGFFRTGYLPPHTIAHLKPTLQQPPPPPTENGNQAAPVFPNAVPNFNTNTAPVPVLTCTNVAALTENPTILTDAKTTPNSTISPLKREWSDSDDFSRTPLDLDASEPPVKKCKSCDANEFRFQYIKNKVETMMLASEERAQKMAILAIKHQRLNSVLMTLFKPGGSSNAMNLLNSSLNLAGDTMEKSILEQINTLVSNNNRLSLIGDDNSMMNLLSSIKF